MSKINHNRPALNKSDGTLLDEWDPHIGNLPTDATFEEKKRAVIDYNRHVDEDLSPGWAERKMSKIVEWKKKRMERLSKVKAPITQCPTRTQHHVPDAPKPQQFEQELKQIKKSYHTVSKNNKAGDPKKSNHNSTKALNDTEAAYCRVNRLDYTVAQLARKFNVSERCVTRCVRGETYKHLNAKYKPWF